MNFAKLINWLNGRHETASLSERLWQETLSASPVIDRLNVEEKARLRKLTEAFLTEKEFATAGDLELTDAMCVSIAAQGCLPILNLGLDYYRGWVGIIVYPDEFIVPRVVEDEIGLVHEFDDIASGEAWEGGPLLISWSDAQMAGDGYNVIIHEFAHKLDMRNGEPDGIPALPHGISRNEWETVLLSAYDDFCAKVEYAEEQGELSENTLAIDPYASENPAEFFAVLTETFFEAPAIMESVYPALFTLFCRYYRQDPLSRESS